MCTEQMQQNFVQWYLAATQLQYSCRDQSAAIPCIDVDSSHSGLLLQHAAGFTQECSSTYTRGSDCMGVAFRELLP